jgi:hypothetical protein
LSPVASTSAAGDPDWPPVADPYRLDPQPELSAALAELESALSGSDCFSAPPPPGPASPASPARALLCDLGLVRAEGERHVPESLSDAVDALDATSSGQAAVVTVIELPPIGDSPLARLLHDLGHVDCPLWRLRFAAAAVELCGVVAVAARAGLVVLLDARGCANRALLAAIDVAVIVSPAGDAAWTVRVLCSDAAVFGKYDVPQCAMFVPAEMLRPFVAIVAFLFFATPGRSKNGCTQVKGPDQFMGGYYARCKQIAQIFERADGARSAILLAMVRKVGERS